MEADVGSKEAKKLKGPPIKNFFYVARGRQVFMGAVAKEPGKVKELLPVMQGILKKIPGMIAIVSQSSLFRRGLGEGRSINIQITGPELEKLVGIGKKVFFSVLKKFSTSF